MASAHDRPALPALARDERAVERLLDASPADVEPAGRLTFARNVFVPLTTACKYTCTYCTYFDPPGDATLLTPAEVRTILEAGVQAGCTEALFTFGDDPDDRYDRIYEELAALGHASIHTYLREMCALALEIGLLPHSNPGDQTREQMATVADVNASMGVMLETTADVAAHAGPRRKTPEQRIDTLRTAGELAIPFTTGILVGIGEGWRDRAESLLTIRALHEQYGHIQEVIVQPVVGNERWRDGTPGVETLRRVVSMARVALPEEISVQVPPNLAPARDVLDCGIDDLGGVSPVTDDHINPDFAWPALDELRAIAQESGVPLRERLPIYERYLPADLRRGTFSGTPAGRPGSGSDGWLPKRVHGALRGDDAAGRRYRSVIETGRPPREHHG